MKKILFLSTLESVPWGGSEQLWSDMALRLLDDGYQVMTNTMEWQQVHPKLKQVHEKGGRVTFRPNPHTSGNISKAAADKLKGLRWKKDVFDFAPDILFINEGGTFDNALHQHGDWLRSLQVPYIVLSNFMPEYLYMPRNDRHFFYDFLRQAKELWFVSRRNLEVAERTLAKNLPNATVITNPIKVNAAPASYPATDTWHMATVARLETEVKGYDILMETFAQPQWRNRNFNVNIYGSGDHLEYLQELVANKGLEDKVIFKGFVNNIVEVWEANHIMLMPSRGEGTPLSLLEANYCKRAAVVTDVGGNADVINEGVNGFVAEAPVVTCFANAMERAWQQREQWEQLGINARMRIDEKYTTDAVQQAINRLLH
ncbi:MAG TPA: glycosyltransferase family 4 protein [Flavipsychrobacter sp.]